MSPVVRTDSRSRRRRRSRRREVVVVGVVGALRCCCGARMSCCHPKGKSLVGNAGEARGVDRPRLAGSGFGIAGEPALNSSWLGVCYARRGCGSSPGDSGWGVSGGNLGAVVAERRCRSSVLTK